MAKREPAGRSAPAGGKTAPRATRPGATTGSRPGSGARTGGTRRQASMGVMLAAIIGGAVLLFAGIVIYQSVYGQNRGLQPTPTPVPMEAHAPSPGTYWGPENAPVKIIEYSNFGCGHCKSFAENSGRQLRKDYEASGKVRFEFRQFELGTQNTADAANAALCAADQQRFWDYHDLLFASQSNGNNPFAKSALKAYGAQLKLDTAKFNACVDGDQRMQDVHNDSQSGLALNIDATPSFVINGQIDRGDIPYADLKPRIDGLIKAAGG